MKKRLGLVLFSCVLLCNFNYISPAVSRRTRVLQTAATISLSLAAIYAARFAEKWFLGNYEGAWDITNSLGSEDYALVTSLVNDIFNLYNAYSASILWTPAEVRNYLSSMYSYQEKIIPALKTAKDVGATKLRQFRNFLSSYLRKVKKEEYMPEA